MLVVHWVTVSGPLAWRLHDVGYDQYSFRMDTVAVPDLDTDQDTGDHYPVDYRGGLLYVF